MPGEIFKAPVGTRDVLPPESRRWEDLVASFAAHARRAGFGLIVGPVFEDIGVFRRVGEGTDIVRKEMYDFDDKGGRRIVLRPEGTAATARAFIQHRPPTPWKVWYAAPSFRYERPQAGRYRQHHQLGVELIGSADPDCDVEVIVTAWDFVQSLGLARVLLLINSMGDFDGRPTYVDALQEYLRRYRGDLAPEDREKIDTHPLRVLDSKRKATRDVTADAPRLLDHLSPSAESHFDRVQTGLRSLGVPFAIEPRLVRGLDYYTHTTFELQASALEAAQNTIVGGGRYDGLVEALGGPPTPGMGFGMGIERLLLAADAEGVFETPEDRVQVWVIDLCGGDPARDLAQELRRARVGCDRGFDGRSMRAQMRMADRSGARLALIVGDEELASGVVAVRDLREDSPQEVVPRAAVVKHVLSRLGR